MAKLRMTAADKAAVSEALDRLETLMAKLAEWTPDSAESYEAVAGGYTSERERFFGVIDKVLTGRSKEKKAYFRRYSAKRYAALKAARLAAEAAGDSDKEPNA